MFLQCLQLTGKLVREPVEEIRLKERRVVVIPATFLAANSSAALALTPATVTAGIYCSCKDAECWAVKRSRGCWAGKVRFGNEPGRFCHSSVRCNVSGCCSERSWQNGGRWRGTQRQCGLRQWYRGMLKEKAELLPGMVPGCCEVHKFLWGVF